MIIRILIEIDFNMAHITTGLISFLMVFILVMRGNVSRTIPEGAINTLSDFECNRDNECLDNNTYCDFGIHLCVQCLDCNIYFRMPKQNIKCAKNISDCSICLNGYLEEKFFDGFRDLCVPIDSNVILPTPEKISSNFYWQDVGIIFIIINMVLIFLLWTYFYKRVWNTNVHISNTLQNNLDILPPSYDSCLKTDNYVTDDVQEFHLFTGEQPPRNEWRHQNAVPFRLLEDIQDNNHMDENENIEEIDGVVMREIEDPELHDEETMPSSWTPPPPPTPERTSSTTQFQNNNSEFCSPPFKRIRLGLPQSTYDINEDNEDNISDMSQD